MVWTSSRIYHTLLWNLRFLVVDSHCIIERYDYMKFMMNNGSGCFSGLTLAQNLL